MIAGYNRFIRANNAVKESTSAIDVLLKQRFDLLPNIIECVKGYAKHEKTTLEELVKLRNNYNSNGFSVSEAEEIDKKFVSIMALSENYPELKADTEYLNLQSELGIVEDQLKDAREIYNHVANNYNTAIEVVPSNIVAAIFGFKKAELFKLEDAKKENVEIKLFKKDNNGKKEYTGKLKAFNQEEIIIETDKEITIERKNIAQIKTIYEW